ncbi:MAG TPA: methyl-accepting chemotaxis protein [Bacillota bacterium]|nr:methyl-accepting chemotaxis protein [Bacillota bacterium]
MGWFLNMKIRYKLLIAFILVALITGVVGFIGVTNIDRVGKNDIELYEDMTVPLQYISEMTSAFQGVQVAARDLILANEPVELMDKMDAINSRYSTMNESAARLKAGKREAKAIKDAVVAFNEAQKSYNSYVDQLLQLAQDNQDQEALALLYGDLDMAATNVQDALNTLVQLKVEAAKAKSADNKAVSTQAVSTSGIIVLLNMLVAIGLGFLISKMISNPVTKLAQAADQLALGDVDVDIHVKSRDEIGQLTQSFERMVANTREQANLAERIAQGDLAVEVVCKSDKDILSQSLQRVVLTLNELVSEAGMLTQSALEGQLETRGDVDKFEGGYREIIQGVNQTLDAVTGPVRVAIDYISRMANGEYVEAIDTVYPGEFQVLMDSLTAVRISLENLLVETTELTRAATEGNLSVRGDLTKFKGWYADIVAGINKTVDTFLEPLSEASEVFSRMAVNDFNVEMSGNYQGMLSYFADAINQVRERLLELQSTFIDISHGDISALEKMWQTGQLSESDQLLPAMVKMMEVIKELIHETNMLSQAAVNGDLGIRGEIDKFEGDYRTVIAGFNQTLDVINEPVHEALLVLQEMVKGNLQVAMTGDYKGDHAALKDGLNQAIESFESVLGEINRVSEQVAAGSRQVSDSSLALSQGASEQASTMEEISASITEIASQTKQNAGNANQANELARTAKAMAVEGNQQMGEMLSAMAAVNESSANISKIIKVIDEIAFQTNILALNAAVEAARAGQYGKGFAVVADEVRNLAARSANAAKETTALIEGSIKKVEFGARIATETAAALSEIVNGVTQTTDLVEQIANASNEQATGIAQINQGVSQVSKVTQSNTATAEQSASASEELASQAEQLKEMVAQFKLTNQSESVLGQERKTGDLRLTDTVTPVIGKNAKNRISLDDQDFAKY